jgi:hypothetical protein
VNKKDGSIKTYDSIRAAALAIEISPSTLYNYINKDKLLKKLMLKISF